jgi:Flp pilus assembly protein TadD
MKEDPAKHLPFLAEYRRSIEENNFARAEELARGSIADVPDHYLGHFLLGRVLRLQHRFAESLPELQRAIELWTTIEPTPHYPAAYFDLALLLREEGRTQEARDAFEKVIAADPNWPDAYGALATLLNQEGNLQEGIQVYERAVGRIQHADLHWGLGQFLMQAKRLEEAEKHLRETDRLSPERAGPLFDLGKLCTQQKRWDEAEDFFRRAVKLQPHRKRYREALRGAIAMADHYDARETLREYRVQHIEIKFHSFPASKTAPFRTHSIPVIPLATGEDLEKVIASLQRISTRQQPVLFRGQNRDWYANENLSVQPALLRKRLKPSRVSSAIRRWKDLLTPFLGELAAGSGALELDNRRLHVGGVPEARSMVSLTYQPELAATMQHYGFPTDFLDVTPALEVALWFALLQIETTDNGVLYKRYAWSERDSIDQWPSIYVFQPWREQVVDLTDDLLAPPFSERVSRQKACLISSGTIDIPLPDDPPWMQRLMQQYRGSQANRDPGLIVILKLKPDAAWIETKLPELDWYFPPADPIYQRLISARAPLMQRYAYAS